MKKADYELEKTFCGCKVLHLEETQMKFNLQSEILITKYTQTKVKINTPRRKIKTLFITVCLYKLGQKC